MLDAPLIPKPAADNDKRREGTRKRVYWLVAPAGFEPAISALRGLRPSPLDDGANVLVGGIGVEPMTSRV